jgi:hypothetical protein
VLRSAAKAEATSAEYVSMAFAALVAEVQTGVPPISWTGFRALQKLF